MSAYTDYIQSLVKHYSGQVLSWDVVNEPVLDNGSGLRPCLWQRVLGDDYIGLALTAAQEADPGALLFINDYNLESSPAKRRTLLKLVEHLQKTGAPIHGIGTQTHIDASLSAGMISDALRDLRQTGLKIHVSEVDISLHEDHPAGLVQPRRDQVRLIDELLNAYYDLPSHQRHGLTFWGIRDSDSWLNHQKSLGLPDSPLLFDSQGRAKPLARRFVQDARSEPQSDRSRKPS